MGRALTSSSHVLLLIHRIQPSNPFTIVLLSLIANKFEFNTLPINAEVYEEWIEADCNWAKRVNDSSGSASGRS
jgi:hypothetical protein